MILVVRDPAQSYIESENLVGELTETLEEIKQQNPTVESLQVVELDPYGPIYRQVFAYRRARYGFSAASYFVRCGILIMGMDEQSFDCTRSQFLGELHVDVPSCHLAANYFRANSRNHIAFYGLPIATGLPGYR